MQNYVIFTDSTCDLPADMADELGLTVLPLSVVIDGKSYKNYLDGRELSFKDFYNSMRNKKLPTTSAVNVYDFTQKMEPVLKAGKDILYIGFSSPMSGTYSAGCVAAKELLEKYPERKILTVDSLSATLAEGLLVYLCAMQKNAGKTMEEVKQFAEDMKLHMCHIFTVNDLFHVMRGGRVSKSMAVFGSILSIKPIMRVDDAGLMDTLSKARGREHAIRMMVQKVKDTLTNTEYPVFIGHGDCLEEAIRLKDILQSELGVKKVYINYLGVVCGSHAGPGILGIFYHGTKR